MKTWQKDSVIVLKRAPYLKEGNNAAGFPNAHLCRLYTFCYTIVI